TDPKSQHAVQLNNKSYDDISWQTLHLFLKIKVLRRPVEATEGTGHSLRVRTECAGTFEADIGES
ncbi:hypothetical protein AB9F29_19990, partial [Falsihalocynthiibacter sp. S25ZX9]|uniref:hypothetical protein n=1 Tax=Falsihalocynthiibacter sp. S25ZX9 TaxID=3240870 RepID=UPI00350FC067